MDGYGVIYKATSPSGKAYVGKTASSLKKRIGLHYYDAKRCDFAFSRALRKYKRNDWDWEILHNIPIKFLIVAEICAIFLHDTYYSGYNSTLGGEGSMGRFPSKKTREKMSANRTGKKNHFYGKQHSNEAKKKIGAASKGRKPSKKTLEKLSKLKIGENNGRAILNREKVEEIRKKYATGKYTRKELSKKYNVSESTIGDIAKYRSWK